MRNATTRSVLGTLLLGALVTTTACTSPLPAVGRTARLPGADVDAMQRFLVLHREGDPDDIENDIRDQIIALGREADAARVRPEDVSNYDAVVLYVDRVWAGLPEARVQLTLYVQDTRTGYIVATATSRQQKTPAGHAKLMLTELFRRSEEAP